MAQLIVLSFLKGTRHLALSIFYNSKLLIYQTCVHNNLYEKRSPAIFKLKKSENTRGGSRGEKDLAYTFVVYEGYKAASLFNFFFIANY